MKKTKTTIFSLTTTFKTYEEFIQELKSLEIHFVKNNQRIQYGNVACTLDLETTSFYVGEEKRALMYAGTIGINGKSKPKL